MKQPSIVARKTVLTEPEEIAEFRLLQKKGYELIEELKQVWRVRAEYPEPGLTEEEFKKLVEMPSYEQFWKGGVVAALVEDGLLGNPSELTLDETKKIIFMHHPKEQKEWRDKLAKRKSSPSQDAGAASENAEAPHFRTARWDERTVSMEIKTLPAVREAAKQIATAHGMTAQEYIESLLVDALNKNPHEVEEGKKRLERFKGSTVAAKRYTQEEELARLRALQHSTSGTPSR